MGIEFPENGEDCERFWPYQRSVAYLTSVVRIENREDTLTLVCLAYNQILAFNLLVKKDKNRKDLDKCKRSLNNLSSYLQTKLELKLANERMREKSSSPPSDSFTKLNRDAEPLVKDLTNLRSWGALLLKLYTK